MSDFKLEKEGEEVHSENRPPDAAIESCHPVFRRTYIINRSFQYRTMLYSLLLAFCIIMVLYGSVSFFFVKFKEAGFAQNLPPDHIFFVFLEVQRQTFNMIFLVVSIWTVIIIIFCGILYSHRIAGPLYKLKKHWAEIMESGGPLKEVYFRKHDYFKDVQDSFNAMVRKLNADFYSHNHENTNQNKNQNKKQDGK
ncbi:MAG: hypothetical protein HQK50_07780 [Oligoflexia bacterium]|nr:hypothetical protein [Oligoflexia bacterium]MBF0365456.1 hypothetical protein [Oligoflexia bacterium]